MLVDTEMPDEAVSIGEIAINIQPYNPELYILVGTAMQKEYRSDEAAEMYEFAIMLGSRKERLRNDYAECLEASGDWQTALNERLLILEQTSQDDPELLIDHLHAVANCAIHAGKPQLAQEVCHQSLKLNPDDGISYSYIGEALHLLNKPAEAQTNLLLATQLSPENSTTWLILANYQRKGGQPSQAKETLLAGLQAIPDSSSIVLALGELFLSQKLYTEALEVLEKVHSNEPNNRDVSISLAEVNLHLGHITEARQLLEKEYRYQPENFKVAYLYAQVQFKPEVRR